MPNSWFSITAAAANKPAEVLIYDYIGAFGVTAKDFNDQLKTVKGDFTLGINSPGGEVFTALAIFNMLERHKGRITVRVDGLAASSASFIAMAGDEIVMPENAMMMIHNPSAGVSGTSIRMRQLAETLDKLAEGMVSAYATKSGLDRDEVVQLMTDETWMTADEAVEKGFADTVEEPVAIAAYFDISKYVHPPEAYGDGDTDDTNLEVPVTTKPETAAEMETRLRAEITTSLAAAAATTVAPVVAAVVAETPADMEARLRASITAEATAKEARAADIRAACSLKGIPSAKTEEFVASAKTVGQVLTELTASATQTVDTTNGVADNDHNDLVVTSISSAAVFAKFNAPKKRA
jgi:ATP-dependent Clp protease protease subunit